MRSLCLSMRITIQAATGPPKMQTIARAPTTLSCMMLDARSRSDGDGPVGRRYFEMAAARTEAKDAALIVALGDGETGDANVSGARVGADDRIAVAGAREDDAPVARGQRAVDRTHVDADDAAGTGAAVDPVGPDAGEIDAPVARVRRDVGALHVDHRDPAAAGGDVDIAALIAHLNRAVGDVGEQLRAQPAHVDAACAGKLDPRRRGDRDAQLMLEAADHDVHPVLA